MATHAYLPLENHSTASSKVEEPGVRPILVSLKEERDADEQDTRSSRRFIPSTWRQTHRSDLTNFLRSTVDDIKHAPWRWSLERFCSHVLPIILIMLQCTIIVLMSIPSFLVKDSVCQPDGSFRLTWLDYDRWNKDTIFAITLSSGSFSFGLAKFIDVAWDVVSLKRDMSIVV